MKLVKLEEVEKGAPSELFLDLSSGHPYLHQDGVSRGCSLTYDAPFIKAAMLLANSDLLDMAARPLFDSELSSDYDTVFYTYDQFQDVIKAFGYSVDNITVKQLRTVLYFMPIIKHALDNWLDLLTKIHKHPGSMPYESSDSLIDMECMQLITVGICGTKQHVMLTVKGARLELVLRGLSRELLTNAAPEQYVSGDHRTINYDRLWTERQGNVKLVHDTMHARLDKLIGDL